MEEVIDSVMQSPENTNPNVLRSQLSKISGGSAAGGGGNVAVFEADAKGVEFNGEHFDTLYATINGEIHPVPISGWYDDVPNGAVFCVKGDPTDEQGKITGSATLRLISCDPVDPTEVWDLALLSTANIMVVSSNITERTLAFIPRNATYAKGSNPK